MNIVAVIPARSGSKSIPNKNIRLLAGKPMLAYSIEHACESKYINRIILSTDSPDYAGIGREYGAEVPFLRPSAYATDTALDIEVFHHCLTFLKEKEGMLPEIVVQLRPTYPIRNVRDIDNMIELLIQHPEADSVRSVAPAKEIPYKMWHKDTSGCLSPLLTDIPECYNMPRQKLPKIYYQNACIDVVRGRVILEDYSMTGKCVYGYEMEKNFDIDDEEDFVKAEAYLTMSKGGRRFVFDIDGVIAKLQPQGDYALSEPNRDMIRAVNKLYAMGNRIVLLTARGYVTGIDWEETTKKQLQEWGLCYHELHFGKPNADYYIDDRMIDMKFLTDVLL